MTIAARSLALLLTFLLVSPTLALAQPADPPLLPTLPDGQRPLEGMPWRLRAYLHRGSEREPGPQVAAWIQLRGGRLTGSGGCTGLRGRYAVAGAALQLDLGSTRAPSCAEQTAMVQVALIEGLGAAAWYELVDAGDAGTELLIRDAAGATVLRFGVDDIAVLDANEWLLDGYVVDGTRAAADPLQPAVLSFQSRRSSKARRRSSGELVGSTGCNAVIAPYQRRVDLMSFGALERTDAPCSGSAALQEAAVLAVLDSPAITLQLPPDHLILVAADSGARLELSSATPLEDTTWLLAELYGLEPLPGTITLRLQGGTVSGEGPCGAYGGSYATDGAFITMAGLEGSDEGTCADQRLERTLLDALGRSVLLDRGDGALTLRDVSGRRLVRYAAPGAT